MNNTNTEYQDFSDLSDEKLSGKICDIWNVIKDLKQSDLSKHERLIEYVISAINSGERVVCSDEEGNWMVNDYIQKAILLYFKLKNSNLINSSHNKWFDKIPLKFQDKDAYFFNDNKIRCVPGSYVRYGAYISKNVILMPCFVNIGAYVSDNTMIDTWSTVGSCAYIGKNCHISGGVGIGGVLEPVGNRPVIIEDNCFIGARSEIAEGVIVRKGSVIAMGVFISASTKIVDRTTGEITYGEIPPYSVVIPGSIRDSDNVSLNCAVILKKVDESTRSKTSINELLRS